MLDESMTYMSGMVELTDNCFTIQRQDMFTLNTLHRLNLRGGAGSMSESEVARLRRQIEIECEALQRVFTDFAAGTARHEFIRIRMEHVENCQRALLQYVGEKEAAHIVAELYMKAAEQ